LLKNQEGISDKLRYRGCMLETFLLDLRYAARMLRQSPTFTVVAMGTLALGIGAAVGIFTVVNAVLLRPLPIREADRVSMIYSQYIDPPNPARIAASWTKYEMLRAQASFSAIGAYLDRDFTIDSREGPARLRGARVTGGFFGVLGIAPSIGRGFSAAEDADGTAPAVIITDGMWKGSLGGDPNVIGKTIRIEGQEIPIVGVLPAGFQFRFSRSEPQVYLNSVETPDVMTAREIHSGAGFLTYVARLKPDATFEQASSELHSLDARYKQEFGAFADSSKFGLRLIPFVEDLVGEVRPVLRVLMVSVLFLLLIACANVAHLLLARATVRRREVAVRLTLGASHRRVVRQFLTEALLLALGGGLLGILFARAAVTTLVAMGPADIPRLAEAVPDYRVLAFAILVTSLTAVVFGVVPSFRLKSVALGESLKDGKPGSVTHRFAGQLQQWIAASETAVTVVLLIAASLLFRSLIRLQAVEPGFGIENITTAQISLQQNKYSEPFQREAFFTHLLDDLRAQPGMAGVGATSYLPMSGSNYGFYFFIEGQPHLGVGRDRVISVRHVSPRYFHGMQIPIQRGRPFSESDRADSEPVAIINKTAARMFFEDVDPLGKRIANSRDGILRRIVGIVGDVRFNGPDHGAPAELYLPYRQVPSPSLTVVVSSSLPLDIVSSAIRQSVRQVDRDQAISEIRTMQRVVASTTIQQRFTSSLLGTFAVVATALAAIGLYGVVAVFVSQRRQEIGVRMALGAQRQDVLGLVMRHGARAISAGIVIGLLGALTLNRLMSGLLYGISSTEPASYAIGAAVLLLSGLLACYLPARRATKVDPARALRSE
jgi:putative ABC transport system permease protein